MGVQTISYARSVARILLPLAAAIFAAEFGVMLILFRNRPTLEAFEYATVDSVLLIVIVLPFLRAFLVERRRAADARAQFIHTISHDLRNPLSVILVKAQYLRRAPAGAAPAAEVGTHAEAIVRSGERMNAMIEDLVDSARAEGGQLRLDRQNLELNAFIGDLLERQRGTLDVDRVKLEAAPEPAWVLADPARLERVVVNLLDNALKYSPPGSEVVIEPRRAKGEVVVDVVDHGRGISPEDLGHVFERFFRAGARSPASRARGVGLGLTIVRALVEAHGGSVWVESELGKGTTFHFSIAAAPA